MEGLTELLDATNLRGVVTVAGIIVGAFAAGRLLVYVLIDLILLRLAKRTTTSLDNLLADAARRPLYFIVVLIGFNIAVGQLEGLDESLQVVIQDVLFVLVMVVGSYLAYRLLVDVLTWYAEEVAQRTETRFDEQFTGFIRRLLQIAMVLVVAIMILSKLEVDVSGLVAGLGVGSLAVALAAQTLLENTIAGFVIMIDRPFVVGDRILLPKDIGGVYGTWGDVLDIGLRITQVRSVDGVVLTIPNSLLTKDVMINFSHMTSPALRVRIRVGLGRQWTNVERGVALMEGILAAHPSVSRQPRAPEVIVREIRAYDVLLEARYYVETPQQMRRVNSDVQSQILQAFEREGVEMSYPTEIALRPGVEG